MLEEIQKQFAQAVNQSKDLEKINFNFYKNIHSDSKLTAEERFSIYKGSITEGLAKSLRETFPICKKLVGEEFFTAMAYHFVAKTPSFSPDLSDYGEAFPTFIESFPSADSVPYLADTARLEWAYQLAYYAPQQQLIDFQKLSAIPEHKQQDIIFQLPICSTLLESPFPIKRIWETEQDDFEGDDTIDWEAQDDQLLIWHKDYEVIIENLTPIEWKILSYIHKEMTFAKLCQKLGRFVKVDDIIEKLPQIVARGWIGNFKIKN